MSKKDDPRGREDRQPSATEAWHASLTGADEPFRQMVESVRDYAIFMLDAEGTIRSWNPGARNIKGYDAGEIIGRHFSVFYPREAVESRHPWRELEIARKVGRFEEEGWRLRKDGSRFWANVVITPVNDDAGRHIGFAKVTRDLTARKHAEEALRESEERFRLMVESVQDYAIFVLDPRGHRQLPLRVAGGAGLVGVED